MEKLPMCRICLVEGVRMYVVVNKNLHELYKKLTDVPFVTEDSRPMLACFFCCSKLKQCWRFQRKCLEAEELFTQIMNEGYEPDPINTEHMFREREFFNGFINSPMVHISIDDGGQTDTDTVKEELPDISECLDDISDPLTEEDLQTAKSELDNLDNYPDVEDTPALHAESDSEDVALMEYKTEVEDELESIGVHVSKKPKLDTRRPRNTTSAEQKKNEFQKISCVSKIVKKTPNHTSFGTAKLKETFTKTHDEICDSTNNTDLSTSFPNNSNIDKIKCKIPNKGVDSDDIKKFRRVCTKEKRFKCSICQLSFNMKSNLMKHIRTHGKKPFKCDICQRSFTQITALTSHTRTHTGEKPFKCDICQRSFRRKNDLTRHTHTRIGEKPIECDICQRSFTRITALKKHTRTHTGEKPFKCDVCQRCFIEKNSLTKHIRTHTGEKPFKCGICQRDFTRFDTLKNHIRTHTGEKPFKCDVCQRSFSRLTNLTTHIRTHTGEKPFKCGKCKRRFNQKIQLTSHIRTHTGEKPFK